MTTERDVYELDTSLAVKNLQAMYDSMLRMEEHMREKSTPAVKEAAEEQGKFGASAVALGTVVGNLVTNALSKLWDSFKSGVTAAMEAERVHRQLTLVAGEYTDALDAQAEALEKQTGASAESLKQVSAMLLRFGVAPADIDKTTRAILDYATATGKDVVDATRMVTMSVENGGSKLEALGIEFESTGRAAADMATAVEGLSKKFGGATATDADTLEGRTRLAQIAMDDLLEAFGGLVIEFERKYQILDQLTLAFQGLQQALFGDAAQQHWKDLGDAYDRQLAQSQEVAKIQKELIQAALDDDADRVAILTEMLDNEKARLEDIKKEIRTLQGASDPINQPGANKPISGEDRLTREGREQQQKRIEAAQKAAEAEAKAREEYAKKAIEAHKRVRDYEREFEAEAAKLAKEKEEREAQRLKNMEALRAQAFEIQKAEMERQNEALMELERQRVANMEASWGKVADFARTSADQILGYFAQTITQFLTTNQSINAEIIDAQVKRRQAMLAEQGVVKTTAELRIEAENERKAAEQQRLASTLANIAIEAGKNALFQGAEAIAAAAGLPFTAPKMAAHITAAAAFAAIAGGAGAAAYGISQSRGRTASEREQIESASRNDRNQQAADAQTVEQGKGPGTQVNVYYLGISGMTEAEQGRELERIRGEYSDMRTGSR